MASTGNLANLNPIVAPDPVGLLPLAPGPKVLLLIALLALAMFAWRRWLAWRDDRYRRQALRELRELPDARGIPDLLRRAALSAYARERVAPLVGEQWHRFLDETAGQKLFSGACGASLDRLAYGVPGPGAPAGTTGATSEVRRLREAAQRWLEMHQRDR
jgi:hypothetical protein